MNVVGAQRINRNQKNAGTRCLFLSGLARSTSNGNQMKAEKDKKDPHNIEPITVRQFENRSGRPQLAFIVLFA
jgi:hypothetical protein